MRFFTVPTVKDARSSAGWALVFIALLYTTAPAVGAMAKMNLHATVNSAVGLETNAAGNLAVNPERVKANADLYAPDASLEYAKRPEWMQRWEKTGLLKFEDKNGDGRIQYYNDKTKNADAKAKADAAGWKGNELTVNADIMVMANPEIALLPNWVIALVAAGGLAAALSTAAGLLMAISSAVSHDLVKGIFNPNISEKNELLAGKVSMAVAIVISGYLGLNPPGFAAGTVALAFGIAASSLFPAIMMGIFSKKMNKEGAVAGMLAGLFVTLFYVFAHKGIFFVKGTEFVDLIGGPNSFFGITPEAFGAGRCAGQLHHRLRCRQGHEGAAGAYPAHGRSRAHPAWFEGCGRRPLIRACSKRGTAPPAPCRRRTPLASLAGSFVFVAPCAPAARAVCCAPME